MAENPTLIWLVAGLLLIVAEAVIPGGIVMFLGAGCLVVSGAWTFALVDTWPQALTLWFISSLVLLFSFRQVIQKVAGGETSVANTDEDMDIYGKVAVVTETIGPGKKPGRIEFQSSTWQALADGTVIEPGEKVKIICHDNISLLVERHNPTNID